MSGEPLGLFHPVVAAWFAGRFGEPTAAQRLAWPRIAAGEHVLLAAPTGSGKTLAAFLWAIDRLLTGGWELGRPRVVYVSPLKALGNDVRRNLLAPLAELRAALADAGEPAPEVRVLTRTGDTPADERARMARRPPEILITTPESLNILLTSRRGRAMLGGLVSVILDEVHAVVGSKRGAHLITAVERLVPLAGEVQRLALSATVRPVERVAEWVGGWRRIGSGEEAPYRRRPVAIVRPEHDKRYDLQVVYPGEERGAEGGPDRLWAGTVAEVRSALGRNRSTVVFANSRRMVEKLTRLVNEGEREERVWAHHGSLSRELRQVVEERLKAGELAGIVATSSLELGIDIGTLDEVVLVQTPPSIASAIQRVGRAGHAVGEVSRGRLVPLVPRDLLDAAVTARALLDGAVEEAQPIRGALDVLAQVVVSMSANQAWPIDELLALLRGAEPYHALTRRQLDLVLDMLAGRYQSARLRDVPPLISLDRVAGTVQGRPGAERRVYMAGGTIPDRGYFHLRVADSGALLGELDEEFVWERAVGDSFTLGVQTWRIERITHNDVLVTPSRARAAMAPFWRADERDRSFPLAERVALLLEEADERLAEPAFRTRLVVEHCLSAGAADALLRFLAEQRAATGRLPHRHRVIVERVEDPQGGGEGGQVVLHTLWGGRVNRPLALALAQATEERYGAPLSVLHDDDCLILPEGGGPRPGELLSLVTSANLEELLRRRLERSGFFGARFREAAGIALLLPREGFRRRTPLWLSRQRAKELLEATARFEDFPLLLEAWRACMVDAFDLEALRRLLDELADARIEVREAVTDRPSPLAAGVVFRRTNELMYEDDTPSGGGPSRLRGDLLREVALAPHLRPRLPRALIDAFVAKLQRTHPGWTPRSAPELLDLVIERVAMSAREWEELLTAIARDGGDLAELLGALEGRLALARLPEGAAVVVAVESLPRLLAALGLDRVELRPAPRAETSEETLRQALAALPDAEPAVDADPLVELIADLLRSHGPLRRGAVAALLGIGEAGEAEALGVLADAGRVVLDVLSDDAAVAEVVDTDNLERLLRIGRAAARPALAPLPLTRLPSFLAAWQGLGGAGSLEALRERLERLFGLPAAAEAWEADILPARLDPYLPAWLDALLADTELEWFGAGERALAFALAGDRELWVGNDGVQALASLLPAGPGRYSFEELAALTRESSAELTRRLWAEVWSGGASNDTFAAVRRGIEARFAPVEPSGGRAVSGRPRFDRWRASRPFTGSWFRRPPVEPPADALEAEERNRERARVVLERCGVVFRELLERELPALSWGRLQRTLRIMELSGEVVSGQFFAGVSGLQFASHAALRSLRDGWDDRLVWMSAADPASACGLGLELELPRRLPTTHMVLDGERVVVVSERRGRSLDLRVPPGDPRLPDALGFLKVLLGRQVRPMSAVAVETINGESAAASPYRPALDELFHVVREHTSLRLLRRR